MAEEPYLITVNGTPFYSDESMAGVGWSYEASYGVLDLTNYSGSAITASGDLTIYSSGNVNVTGSSGSYGINAITVSGTLNLFVISGTTTLQGGTGTVYGGDGISTSTLYVYSLSSSSGFICRGGYGTTYGGYGIYGEYLELDPDYAEITGGGSSATAGYGIVFLDFLYIGVCNMTVQAGSASSYAVATMEGAFYYSTYCNLVQTGTYKIIITPKIFTLILNGNGGLYQSQSSWPLSGMYPSYYNLGNYVFTRNEYAQVG